MKTQIISLHTLEASTWSGGKTYQYYIAPESAQYANRNFLYRISSATIDIAESQFTQFEGYNRYLVMLDNDLNIKHNGITKSFKPLEVFSFYSEDDIISYSKGSDFNLMVSRVHDHTKIRIASGVLDRTATTTLLFALSDCTLTIHNKEHFIKEKDLIILDEKTTSLLLPTDFIIMEW